MSRTSAKATDVIQFTTPSNPHTSPGITISNRTYFLLPVWRIKYAHQFRGGMVAKFNYMKSSLAREAQTRGWVWAFDA